MEGNPDMDSEPVYDSTPESEMTAVVAKTLRLAQESLSTTELQAVEDEVSGCLERLKAEGHDTNELIRRLGLPPRLSPPVRGQPGAAQHDRARALRQARQHLSDTAFRIY